MKTIFSLILILIFSFFITHHNSYSYHVLNSSSGSTFVFEFLPSMPVDFNIDGGTLGGGNGLPFIQRACDEWDSLPDIGDFCGNLNQIGTDITSENFDTIVNFLSSDGVHYVVFDDDGLILSDLGLNPNITLGFGFTLNNSSGAITDITIILNGTIPQSSTFDYEGLTVHEMGHTWGLAHTPIGGINTVNSTAGLDPISEVGIPTMFPFAFPTNDQFSRSLEPDDFASALLLYGPN